LNLCFRLKQKEVEAGQDEPHTTYLSGRSNPDYLKKVFSNFVENVKQKGTHELVPCKKGLAGENDCAPLI
jgi:hypothetical protein